MEWKDIFPQDRQPEMEQIFEYIGGDAQELWKDLLQHMQTNYKVKPKLTYSVCSGKPGWNIKLQKSGISYGTLYPEENSFSVFLVISYKLDPFMESVLPKLSPEIADMYRNAGDFMKQGKWMMFRIHNTKLLEDYKLIASVKKSAPK
ncbi:MAG: DUF3788 domain-containing protein [Bacillota bacterium]